MITLKDWWPEELSMQIMEDWTKLWKISIKLSQSIVIIKMQENTFVKL